MSHVSIFNLNLLICYAAFSCAKKSESPTSFHLPQVISITKSDSLRLFEANSIMEQSAFMLGVFGFTDTLDFIRHKPFPLLQLPEDQYDKSTWDSLPSYGLEMYPDYQKDVFWPVALRNGNGTCFYLVFIANNTTGIKSFFGTDSYAFAIQEAQDSSGHWYPIEMSGIYWGCSRWCIQMETKTFAVLLLPKYNGDFKTKLRVRLRNGDQTYVSQSFEGMIDHQQFKMHPNAYFWLKRYALLDISDQFFFGALPREARDAEAFEAKIKNASGHLE
ncbi:hypothetical protein Halhy_5783 [Haliscomenobacter hydrossis DSM 1100]|uniref:Uncharacterized protein n=2 Tax=Haliscomenobacter TaxID=2349 RepID=F4KX06_HALH1|nr:hypothetical protein Halhy_5783 [Haliscomenobacter hydrossis DSM 1100]